jgi:hypothetical protein
VVSRYRPELLVTCILQARIYGGRRAGCLTPRRADAAGIYFLAALAGEMPVFIRRIIFPAARKYAGGIYSADYFSGGPE